MKIISKYKDYYDYLVYQYGEDEKIVLDRRKGEVFKDVFADNTHPHHRHSVDNDIILLCVCNVMHIGVIKSAERKVYWNEDIKTICPVKEDTYFRWRKGEDTQEVYAECGNYNIHAFGNIPVNINTDLKCPIVAKIITTEERKNSRRINTLFLHNGDKLDTKGYNIYPKLEDISAGSVLSPQDIYLQLCEWLAPKEDVQDNMSNEEKVESHGFDKKKSFRNMKRDA
jgi:hypothetical protein